VTRRLHVSRVDETGILIVGVMKFVDCDVLWRWDWVVSTSKWPHSCWRCSVACTSTSCSYTASITATSSTARHSTSTMLNSRRSSTSMSTDENFSLRPVIWCVADSRAHICSDEDDSPSSEQNTSLTAIRFQTQLQFSNDDNGRQASSSEL